MSTVRPHLLVTVDAGAGLRTVDDLRRDIASGFAKQMWCMLLDEAQADLQRDPYAPRNECNRDYLLVRKTAKRMQRDALAWLLTNDRRYVDDAIAQIEALFDETQWPQWLDQRHIDRGLIADLRTGQLLRAFGYTYDWMYDALSDAQRQWMIEGFDRRGLQPYLQEVERNAWFTGTERMNNWNTVVVGGAGTAAMALGPDHPQSQRIFEHAVHVMDAYSDIFEADGEFNESVGYAGSVQFPIQFHATHRYHTRGEQNRLASSPFPEFCRWYMHMLLPPNRYAAMGDGFVDLPPSMTVFAPVAAATGDGILQWFYVNHVQPGVHSDLTLDLLMYDPTIEPVSPDGRVSLGRAYRAHGATWSSRTDWNPQRAACVVYGKGGHGGEIHGQHDIGQVCIDAYGERLIVDHGYPRPDHSMDYFGKDRWRFHRAGVIGHNVVMIGGREMRDDRDVAATIIDAQFDDKRGGHWIVDTTAMYDGARCVRRSVVHLHPAVVAVLDEVELNAADDISLRWHTVDRCEPDAQGCFTVVAGDVRLACVVAGLDKPLTSHRAEHGGEDRESFIETTTHAASCRMLSLFGAFAPGHDALPWRHENGVWQLGAEVSVALTADGLAVRNGDAHWTARFSEVLGK